MVGAPDPQSFPTPQARTGSPGGNAKFSGMDLNWHFKLLLLLSEHLAILFNLDPGDSTGDGHGHGKVRDINSQIGL